MCDIFSAGVILYVLLTGEPLFEKKNQREQLELNRKCDINFNHVYLDTLDATDKDFFSKMLARNAEHRWEATDLLKHKYFAQQEDQIESGFQNNMESFI